MSYFIGLERHAIGLERHAAKAERSTVALKRGVGDHTPEKFADHELGSWAAEGIEPHGGERGFRGL